MAVHFPQQRATFIHVPKTGGTSFYTWIEKNLTGYDQQAENIYETGCVVGAIKQWNDLGTVFSFVRNPYSRLVSMYEYQFIKAKQHVEMYKPGTPMQDSYMDHLKLIALSRKGFDHWVTAICTDDPAIYSIYDGHPDRISVASWFRGSMPNFVIKTENLNQEFYKIRELLAPGNTDPLPWVNTTEHKPYREYYNETTKQLVAEKFKDDLDLFDYDF